MKNGILFLMLVVCLLGACTTVVGEQLYYRSDHAAAGLRQPDPWETGNKFMTGSTPPTITALGYIDLNDTSPGVGADGDGMQEEHTVSLWLDVAGTLVTSVVIPAGTGSDLIDGYRWVQIPEGSLTLLADTEYVVSADTTDVLDLWLDEVSLTPDAVFIGTNVSTTWQGRWGTPGTRPDNSWQTGTFYGAANITTEGFTGPSNPDPANGSANAADDVTQLSWTYPDPITPPQTLTADVHLQEVTPGYDPNFAAGELLVAGTSATSVAFAAVQGKAYEWRVTVYDPSNVESPVVGPVWSFNTMNLAPTVDAGLNQSVWLDLATTATVTLTGTVTDDDQPAFPAVLTYTWTKTSGSPNGVVNAGTATGPVVDGEATTTVDFTGAGKYVFELKAEDDPADTSGGFGLAGVDTITVYVYQDRIDGLVAHWPFDTDFDDTVGAAPAGTPFGDATIDSDAQVGAGSLLLDGDDYVDVGGGTADPNFPTWANPLTLGASAGPSPPSSAQPSISDIGLMSVTCWVKSTDMFNWWAAVVSKGNEDGWKIQRIEDWDDVMFTVNNADGANSNDSPAVDNVQDDAWHHIAGVFMGDASYIYIDGILAQATPWTPEVPGVPVQGGMPLWIGDHPDWPGNGFAGRIDDVKLYQVPLNAERVLAEYIAGGGSNSCGGKYSATDLNQNCHNDIGDFAVFAAVFMDCIDVTDPACL